MAKSCAYRKDISDACNWHQDEALNSTIYILYQTGPTGFLLKEEGESKNFKVYLQEYNQKLIKSVLIKFRLNRSF